MSQISGSIKVAANKPVDTRFRKFASVNECLTEIESWCRYEGLEVNINGTKYWFRNGVNDNNLVPMPSGGGGSTSDDITNESGVTGATVTNALDTLNAIALDAMNDAENAGIAATSAISAANTANSNALNAQSAASSALTVANAAQTTANNAQTSADTAISGLATKENASNKSTSVPTDSASNTKYPSVKAVFDWVTSLGYITASALTGYATQAWVNAQGFITNVVTSLGYTPENAANKGASNGYAPLGSDSRVPAANAPSVIKAASQNTSQASVGNVTTEAVVQTITIPANTLSVGDVIRITGVTVMSGSGGTRIIRVRQTNVSGTAIVNTSALAATNLAFQLETVVTIVSSTQAIAMVSVTRTYEAINVAPATLTIDLTQPISFVLTGQKAVSTDVITGVHFGALIQKA